MTRTPDVCSFTDHRRLLRQHIQQVRESGRPLYVTTNGRTDAVLLSPEAYDELVDKAELADSLALLERSRRDVEAGRTLPARAAIQRLAKELGLKLERWPTTKSK